MSKKPVRVTIHLGVNGRIGGPANTVTISNPDHGPYQVRAALHELARTIERRPELLTGREDWPVTR